MKALNLAFVFIHCCKSFKIMGKEEATLNMLLGQQQDLKDTPWYKFKERRKIKKCIKRLQNYLTNYC